MTSQCLVKYNDNKSAWDFSFDRLSVTIALITVGRVYIHFRHNKWRDYSGFNFTLIPVIHKIEE